MDSPIFQRADYTSSEVPTQFSDAVQRAEFNNVMKYDWHTLLKPSLKPSRTLSVASAMRSAISAEPVASLLIFRAWSRGTPLCGCGIRVHRVFPARSSVNSAEWSAFVPGNLTTVYTASMLTPDAGITVTRIQVQLSTPSVCAVAAVVEITDIRFMPIRHDRPAAFTYRVRFGSDGNVLSQGWATR